MPRSDGRSTCQQFETFLEERLHLSLQDTGAGQPVVSFSFGRSRRSSRHVTSRPPAHWHARHSDNESPPHEHIETTASRNSALPSTNAFAAGTASSLQTLRKLLDRAARRQESSIATHAIAQNRPCFPVATRLPDTWSPAPLGAARRCATWHALLSSGCPAHRGIGSASRRRLDPGSRGSRDGAGALGRRRRSPSPARPRVGRRLPPGLGAAARSASTRRR
jgi:hypothetical protein